MQGWRRMNHPQPSLRLSEVSLYSPASLVESFCCTPLLALLGIRAAGHKNINGAACEAKGGIDKIYHRQVAVVQVVWCPTLGCLCQCCRNRIRQTSHGKLAESLHQRLHGWIGGVGHMPKHRIHQCFTYTNHGIGQDHPKCTHRAHPDMLPI